MTDIITFNSEVANRIFNKLSNFYDLKIVEEWKEKLNNDINELFKKYSVTYFKLNDKSYMGVVIECKSQTHGDIIIKVLPPMINRYKTEVGTLKRLPRKLTCKIYETDFDKTAIVMERIIPGSLVDFDLNKESMKELFDELYKNKIEINEDIDKSFKDFKEVVDHDYNMCKKNKVDLTTINVLYDKFNIRYKEICNNSAKYLLHGDIYKNNILLGNNELKIIDPLGFKAPFVMELVSICAYEMFNSVEATNYNLIIKKYINFFKAYTDEKTYRKALFCQLVKVFIPSIYEANDGGIRAKKWLDIIKELYSKEFN